MSTTLTVNTGYDLNEVTLTGFSFNGLRELTLDELDAVSGGMSVYGAVIAGGGIGGAVGSTIAGYAAGSVLAFAGLTLGAIAVGGVIGYAVWAGAQGSW